MSESFELVNLAILVVSYCSPEDFLCLPYVDIGLIGLVN